MQGRNFDYGHQKSDSKEGQMARRALLTMAKDLYNLYITLNDHDDLPEWCHYKLATSRKDLSDITDYLTSKVMKMCVDKNISTEDLRLEINNSMSENVLEEGFFDFFNRKKKHKKKLNVYDILNVNTFNKHFDSSKADARGKLLRNPIIQLVINVGNLGEFVNKAKHSFTHDLDEDMQRQMTIMDYFGLKDKFLKGADRQAIFNIIKMIERKLPDLSSSPEDIGPLVDKKNLKYDIDFNELNKNLQKLGIMPAYNEKNIHNLLQKIDKDRHKSLSENFYKQLVINISALKQSQEMLATVLGSMEGSIKENKNIMSVKSQEAKNFINNILNTLEKENAVNAAEKLKSNILNISNYLNISHGHLLNSVRNNIRLALKVNGSLLSFYNGLQKSTQDEMLRLNVDMHDRSKVIDQQNIQLDKLRKKMSRKR